MIKVSSKYDEHLNNLLEKEDNIVFEDRPTINGKCYLQSCFKSIRKNLLIVRNENSTNFFHRSCYVNAILPDEFYYSSNSSSLEN